MNYNSQMGFMENETIKKYLQIINDYKVYIIFGIVLFALIVGGFFGYRYHNAKQSAAAHKDLIECMKYYDAPILSPSEKSSKKSSEISFSSNQEKWTKVEKAFENAYEKNKSSSLSGIFLTFISEAMLRLGKNKESLEVLSKALNEIPSKTLKAFYDVKYSLMLLDDKNEANKNLGLSKLKSYSQDFDSVVNDEVLFRLGSYYWYANNFDEARNYWNQLVHKYGSGTKDPSPWVDLAKVKLKLITGK